MTRAALLLCALSSGEPARVADDGFVAKLFAGRPERFGPIVDKAGEHKLEILVSEVVEKEAEKPRLVRHGYRVDLEYFYPASAIKICAAVAALEAVGDLRAREPQVCETTPLVLHPLFEGHAREDADPSNLAGGTITVEHEIRKMCLASDNAAFNRLYALVGQRALNESMWKAGLASARVFHRLSEARTEEENQRSPRIDLLLDGFALALPERKSDLELTGSALPGTSIGKGWKRGGELVSEPLSFARKNAISLVDLQDLLVKVCRRDIDLDTPPFRLTDAQHAMLVRALTEHPAQSDNPRYEAKAFPVEEHKLFLSGIARVVAKQDLVITSKSGRAYGFTVDNAYIVETRSKRAFFLAAVLYTNADGVLNDDAYEYATIADAFFADLGESVAAALWK